MIEFERALIGTVLMFKGSIHDATVEASDFHDPRHEAVWTTLKRMVKDNIPLNAMNAWDRHRHIPAEERRDIDAVWFLKVSSAGKSRAEVEYLSKRVSDAATTRRVGQVGLQIAQMAEQGVDASEMVERARKLVDDAATIDPADLRSMGETIDETIDRLEEPARFTPTPWDDLNHLIGGLRPGALYVVGARPGSGKTVLGLQLALHMSNHGSVLFSSMEMPRNELNERAIAQVAKVSNRDLERRTVSPIGWERIAKAREHLNRALFVDDRSLMTPTEIRSAARTVSRKGQLKAIVVDYVQLMSSPEKNGAKRHEIVADFSRQLKILAKDMDVPVIALSQLNRASEGREGKLPSMADLRETGALEQDADVVMLLHRDPDRPDELKLAVAKNRHGIAGNISLTFEGAYARITQKGWSPTGALEAS